LQKDSASEFAQISRMILPILHPKRGAARDRHGRWERDAMDAHRRAQSLARRAAFVRTAKSCGSGAPTLALSERNDPLMTVAKKPGHREEHEGNR
jgi:hypothetical protein